MKKHIQDKYLYFVLFLFFIIIFSLSPICGDDWTNYIEGSQGLKHSIGQAIGMYFDWEGRFISRVLINILTYHKWIWNIANSIVIVSIIHLIKKIIKPKNETLVILLSTLSFLVINPYMFSQVVVWLAGNITYLFVIPLLLYYLENILKFKVNSKPKIILLALLNFIIPMFIEHIGVVIVLSNILFLGYDYIKTKKINKEKLLYLTSSLFGLSIMLFSPGSIERNKIENVEFNKLNIFSKISYNLPNFIHFTFPINPYLTLIFTYSNYYLIRNQFYEKHIKKTLYALLLIIPVIYFSIILIQKFGVLNSINCYNIFTIIYFILYLLGIFILLIRKTIQSKNNKAIFFYIIGISANTAMLVSPVWDYRTAYATYLFLIISSLSIIDENVKLTNIKKYFLFMLAGTSMILWLILYISIHRQYLDNKKIIAEAIKNQSKIVKIVKYPDFINTNINPADEYHIEKYKIYHGLKKDQQIELIANNWKYLIFYQK